MSGTLFFIGLGKVAFGIVAGAVGVFVAIRLLARMMRWGETDAEIKRDNVAAATLAASSLVAFGLVMQPAVTSTFAAMDLMYRGQKLHAGMFGRFFLYGLIHVGVSLAVGACALAVGTWIFGYLTRGVDELAEAKQGKVSPALVLGAVMIVMALVTAPGLQTALEGLLPLPALARDEVIAPEGGR